MTISELKAMEDILACLEGQEKVFLLGCSDCASVVQVGGEDQLKQMAQKLEESGKKVTGMLIGEPGCHLLHLKQQLRQNREALDAADAVLVMSCGTGAQTAAQATDRPVHTATNTLFLGCVQRFGQFAELCSACGSCTLEKTGMICTVTRCAKGLANGPCGGTTADGKCEVDPETDCGWLLVYQKLKESGKVGSLKEYVGPRDAHAHPGRRKVETAGGKE